MAYHKYRSFAAELYRPSLHYCNGEWTLTRNTSTIKLTYIKHCSIEPRRITTSGWIRLKPNLPSIWQHKRIFIMFHFLKAMNKKKYIQVKLKHRSTCVGVEDGLGARSDSHNYGRNEVKIYRKPLSLSLNTFCTYQSMLLKRKFVN